MGVVNYSNCCCEPPKKKRNLLNKLVYVGAGVTAGLCVLSIGAVTELWGVRSIATEYTFLNNGQVTTVGEPDARWAWKHHYFYRDGRKVEEMSLDIDGSNGLVVCIEQLSRASWGIYQKGKTEKDSLTLVQRFD